MQSVNITYNKVNVCVTSDTVSVCVIFMLVYFPKIDQYVVNSFFKFRMLM